jgi:uncharacterized protein (DUF2336 family)
LIDADLVDGVATGGDAVQAAIASRAVLPSAVAAALAELGSAEACQILGENNGAEIAPLSVDRMVERFGDVAAIRDALLERDDLPAATRQNLVTRLSQTLVGFVASRSWLEEDRAQRIGRAAAAHSSSLCERPAHRGFGFARAAIGQHHFVRRSIGRVERNAAWARVGACA